MMRIYKRAPYAVYKIITPVFLDIQGQPISVHADFISIVLAYVNIPSGEVKN